MLDHLKNWRGNKTDMKINKDKVKVLATERPSKIWRSGVDNIQIKWVKEKELIWMISELVQPHMDTKTDMGSNIKINEVAVGDSGDVRDSKLLYVKTN